MSATGAFLSIALYLKHYPVKKQQFISLDKCLSLKRKAPS